MTHPHLEGLIPDRLLPDDGNGDEDAYNSGWNACIAEVARRLAALPGGGVEVDEAMTDRACDAYEGMTKGFCATHKQAMFYALKTALSPTPKPHEADRNG